MCHKRTFQNGWTGIELTVYRIATGWTVQGSNPSVGERLFVPVKTGPGVHPAPSDAEVEERIELQSYTSYPLLRLHDLL